MARASFWGVWERKAPRGAQDVAPGVAGEQEDSHGTQLAGCDG